MRTPQEIRVESKLRQRETGLLKQVRVREFDRAVYADVAKTLGLTHYQTLHPSWMYEGLAPFWEQSRGAQWLQRRMAWSLMTPPPMPEGLVLPDSFVAVRFYARATFPLSPLTMDVVAGTLAKLAQTTPVVILDSPVHADEHLDIIPKTLPAGVQRLSTLTAMTPENNLLIQSAVMGKSLGFVGTYGGLAQLALRMRKPSVSLYADWHGTMVAHKHLSDQIATITGISFQVFRVTEIPLSQTVLPLLKVQEA